MKKITVGILVLLLILTLSVTAFAAGERVAFVEIQVEAPVSGAMPTLVTAEDVKIVLASGSEELTPSLTEGDGGDYAVSSHWESRGMEEFQEMGEGETFFAFAEYKLTITITILRENMEYPQEKDFIIKYGEGAAVNATSPEGGFRITNGASIVLENTYTCIPQDVSQLQPQVGLEEKGELEKEYNGEFVELTVVFEKKPGASYSYQWKKDGEIVDGATEETLKIKNVADSGTWVCEVRAWFTADPEARKCEPSATLPVTAEITPHALQIVIDDVEKNQHQPDPELTYTVNGELYDELELPLIREEGETIGIYDIYPDDFELPEELKGNYEIDILNGKFTIVAPDEVIFNSISFDDVVRIVGYKKSRIRITAPDGFLGEGETLSLGFPGEKERNALAAADSKKVIKTFAVSAAAQDGTLLSMPRDGLLRFQVPLTEEEMNTLTETVRVRLYAGGEVRDVESRIVSIGGVSYVAFELKTYGSVALYEGDPRPVEAAGEEEGSENEGGGKEDSNLWLWILIAVLTLIAVGAIVFTVVWTGMNKPAPRRTAPSAASAPKARPAVRTPEERGARPAPKSPQRPAARVQRPSAASVDSPTRPIPTVTPVPVKPSAPEGDEDMKIVPEKSTQEKERLRLAAEKINAMPPAPGMEKARPAEEKKAPKKEPRVVSFEDLED